MRIGVQTWGTEGDLRPFFALAQGLAARGHEVKLVYSNVEGRSFDALAASCGIDARSIGGDYFLANNEEIAKKLAPILALANPLKQVRGIIELTMDPIVDEMIDAASELAASCDAVVGHFMTYPAGAAAAAHRKPYIIVSLAPVNPSIHYAPVGTPNLGRLFNPILWWILGRVLESVLKDRVNRTRSRVGLPPIEDLLAVVLDHAVLALTAVSPSLFGRPADWDPRIQIPGFLNVPEIAEPWEPEPRLRAFLDAGPPPAFLSFGSLLNFASDAALESVRAMVGAVKLAGVRGIIQAPKTLTDMVGDEDDSVCFITRAAHARLFPMCSVIVHHGGAGTTQSATLAGRPSLIVPHGVDQVFWGDLMHARGIGPKPLTRTKLTAPRLAALLRKAVNDPTMRARAEAASLELQKEDGVAKSAELIEQAVLSHRSAE